MRCHARRLGPRRDVARAPIVATRLQVQRVHRIGPLAQSRGHGVKTEDGAGIGQGDADSGRTEAMLVYLRPGSPRSTCAIPIVPDLSLATDTRNFLVAFGLVVAGLLPMGIQQRPSAEYVACPSV